MCKVDILVNEVDKCLMKQDSLMCLFHPVINQNNKLRLIYNEFKSPSLMPLFFNTELPESEM